MTQNERIVKWNEDRGLLNLDYDIANEMSFIIEEVLECMTDMKSEEARESAILISKAIRNGNTKKLAKYINKKNLDIKETNKVELSKEQIVDGANDIKVFSTGLIKKTGYDPDLSMDEVLKEIESRTGNMIDGKFVKNKSVEAQSKWYKANFNKALDKNGLKDSINEYIFSSVLGELNDKLIRMKIISNLDIVYGKLLNDIVGDYSIICDETNNTPSTIDNNEFNLDIIFDEYDWKFSIS